MKTAREIERFTEKVTYECLYLITLLAEEFNKDEEKPLKKLDIDFTESCIRQSITELFWLHLCEAEDREKNNHDE